MKVGNTPLRKLNIKGLEGFSIYTKLESYNPSGSTKDRMVKYIVNKAIQRNELKKEMTILEATTGNTGISLSHIAEELGYNFIATMPENNSPERIKIMQQNGAEVILTPAEAGPQGAINKRDALLRDSKHFWSSMQFTNHLNVEAQKISLGREIIRDFADIIKKPTLLVHGLGTGGTLMGVSEALKSVYTAIRVIAVEPAESAVLSGKKPGEHGIQGIGEGFIPNIVNTNVIDKVVPIYTKEALKYMKNFYRSSGISLGISSGANLVAIRKLSMAGHIKSTDTIITIFADGIDRYLSILDDIKEELPK